MQNLKTYSVQHFFDPDTFTLTYVVYDEQSKDAVVIDPVLNYEPATGAYSTRSAEDVLEFVNKNELKLYYIIDTHAHADHISAMQHIKQAIPSALTVISHHIETVHDVFHQQFNLPKFKKENSGFDCFVKDGDCIEAGRMSIQVLETPGHTPACTCFMIGGAVFTGDTLFMPDFGTGRCDFPKGDAALLYTSIQEKLYTLPETTRIFVGHDYMPGGRALKFESTIKEQKQNNIHIQAATLKKDFVQFRQERDKTLNAPRLLLPSIQINIQAGQFPEAEDNGLSYIKLPLIKK